MAGTETGVMVPTPAFSACFGAPFMPLPITKYVKLFREKLQLHWPRVCLINTGWIGPREIEKRVEIQTSRDIVENFIMREPSGTYVRNDEFHLSVSERENEFIQQKWSKYPEKFAENVAQLRAAFVKNEQKLGLK
jgi:phosphoenolpyruvate carboxykinase (ATP)